MQMNTPVHRTSNNKKRSTGTGKNVNAEMDTPLTNASASERTSAVKKGSFIQIRPWLDCINNCTFCSLQDRSRKTSLEQKKIRLNKTSELVKTLDAKTIGLIGGDFFEGQLKGCEKEWVGLLETLLKTQAQILITANLIHEQYFLDETIGLLKKRLLLCTSYDELGRFHTKQARDNWFAQIERLHNLGVNIFCTCIPTQDFLEAQIYEQPKAETKLPAWLNINLCDPHLGVDWYIHIDKNTYHEHLIKENTLFNLPKRKTAIQWMKQNPSAALRYADYNNTHSDTIYGFDKNNMFIKEIGERLNSRDFVNPACGHPFFSQCYADSNQCMMCDADHIAQI